MRCLFNGNTKMGMWIQETRLNMLNVKLHYSIGQN